MEATKEERTLSSGESIGSIYYPQNSYCAGFPGVWVGSLAPLLEELVRVVLAVP